jgi:hypothetical protein
MLAEKEEILANLTFGKRSGIALNMLGQLSDIPDIFLFGGRPIIFKLDELLELRDRREVDFHEPKDAHESRPFGQKELEMKPQPQSPCRAAAQFNKTVEATAAPRLQIVCFRIY